MKKLLLLAVLAGSVHAEGIIIKRIPCDFNGTANGKPLSKVIQIPIPSDPTMDINVLVKEMNIDKSTGKGRIDTTDTDVGRLVGTLDCKVK